MKRIGLVALGLLVLSALFAGTAWGSAPGPHVTGATATCDGSALRVTFHLENVPTGMSYLAVVNGAAQKSQTGTTDGSNQIVVDIPGSCPAVCGGSLDVDMSLTAPDFAQDTPFLNIPISCGTPGSSTSTTTVQTLGSTVQRATTTTTTAQQPAATSTTLKVSGITAVAPSASQATGTGGTSAALGASATRTGSGSSLPFTGGSTLPLLAAGLAGIGAGTGLIVTGKRRAAARRS
jgi:hypothetical protein